jgi:gliding motility-associated-like protein
MKLSIYRSPIRVALLTSLVLIGEARQANGQCGSITGNFSFTPAGGCSAPKLVTFTNTSTGGNSNNNAYYLWFVNGVRFDSTFGTATGTSTLIPGGGTYTLRMQVRRVGNGCSQNIDKTYTFTSSAPQVYDGNGTPSYSPVWTNCIVNPNAASTYSVDVSSPSILTNYTINWGDGTDDTGAGLAANATVNHVYAALGVYTVQIISTTGGCTDTIIGTVRNLRPPIPSILPVTGGTYSGCAPLPIVFRDSTLYALPGTTITWNFGVPGGIFTRGYQQANDTINFVYPLSSALATCPKNITLTVSNPACGSPVTSSLVGFVNVFNKSAAAITTPANLCVTNRTYTFTNSSTNNCVGGDRYRWVTSDTSVGWTSSKGPVTITFPSLGSQNIKLIDSNACGIDSTIATIVLNRPPAAGFTASPLEGCGPLVVNFTDTSIGNSLTRSWNFGDPSSGSNTSLAANPVHTFNNAGTYTVQLTVSNTCPPSSSTTRTIRVYSKPVIHIGGATSGCVPHTVTLSNNSTGTSPTARILWDFGGGDTTSASSPGSRTFNTPGSYPVKLLITDTCGTDSATLFIQVSTRPVADFTASGACAGDTTYFSNTSAIAAGDSITDATWFFGDGDSATGLSTQHRYTLQGNYQAVLRVTTDKSCTDFDTLTVNVKPSPIVSFTAPAGICDHTAMSFDGSATTASGSITSVRWVFDGTDTITTLDTQYRFAAPGIHSVRLEAVNSLGCSSFITASRTVHPLPAAVPVAVNACLGQVTQFHDSSTVLTGTITQWAWDLNNDGNTDSTGSAPTLIYPSAGAKLVRLIVGTDQNCFDTGSVSFPVNPLPVASVVPDALSKCMHDPFVLQNLSTGAVYYHWSFGDSSSLDTSLSFTLNKSYSDSGTYPIRLVAFTSNGCSDTASVFVQSHPLPRSSFTVNDTIGCAPAWFTFNNTSLLADTFTWLINGAADYKTFQRSDTTVELAAQSFTVALVARNQYGCRADTNEQTLRTFSSPSPAFTSSVDSGCGPLPVTFTNNTAFGPAFQWKTGYGNDTNPIHHTVAFPPSGITDTSYLVTLIATSLQGCSDSVSKLIRVFPSPVTAFVPDVSQGCGPLDATFTNYSLHKAPGTINDLLFNWSFGDGASDTTRDPVHRFTASAVRDTNYITKLVITTLHGCRDSVSSGFRVFPDPRAAFSPSVSAGCGPLSATFTNQSVPNDTGSISMMSFAWDFGNGTTSSSVHPSASFVSALTRDTVYDVKLIAVSEHGCRDTLIKNVRTWPKPLSLFTVSDTAGCGPLQVSFANASLPYDTGSINDMTFVWDLGNGFMSLAQNPAANYVGALLLDTVYHPVLIAYSEHGCADTSTAAVRVHPKPFTAFSSNKTQGCGPLNVSFTNTSQLAWTYSWSFGDNDTSTLASPSHTFRSYPLYDSAYEVSLSVVSYFGCAGDTVRSTVITKYNPVADFGTSADSLCGQGSVAFFNMSAGGVANAWSFGNGTTSTQINPVTSFSGPAEHDTTFFVRLIVTTPYNCRDTAIKPVTVNPLPFASFATPGPGCTPLQAQLVNTSQRATRYEWDFGDATTDSAEQPIKTFVNPSAIVNRVFPLTLKVFSSSGCFDTARQNVTVYPAPVAAFNTNNTARCDSAEFTFTNMSSGATSYTWKFGYGDPAMITSPTHAFPLNPSRPGGDTLYLTTLTATSINGCRDSVSKAVVVVPRPHAAFDVSDTAGCSPFAVSFTNQSVSNDTSTSLSFVWNFGNGTSGTSTDPSMQYFASPSGDSNYQVKLIAFGRSHCPDTAYRLVTARTKPVVAFAMDKTSGCGPLTISFTNNSQLAAKYYWNFGTGDTAGQQHPQHIFNRSFASDTLYTVSLTAQSAYGCPGDTVRKNVLVRQNPEAGIISTADTLCGTGSVSFYNASSGAVSNQWLFGNGSAVTSLNGTANFTAASAHDTGYQVRLIVNSIFGCRDTALKYILVHPLPEASFTYTEAGCTPLANILTATSARGVKHAWDFDDGIADTGFNLSRTMLNPFSFIDRRYTVTLTSTSAEGCTDTSMRMITVHPLPLPSFSATKVPRCDTAEFSFQNSTLGATDYVWNFGDGTTATGSTPTHLFRPAASSDTTYQVKLKTVNLHGCSDSTTMPVAVKPLVKADFSSFTTSSCENLTVQFNNNSVNGSTFFWTFGDGDGSTAFTPGHLFSQTGSYRITLIAFDASGCSDTAVKNDFVKVFGRPAAGFFVSPQPTAMPDATIQFTDVSQNASGALAHTWDFGDATSSQNNSQLQHPAHHYTDSGNYNIRLVVENMHGCRDTSTQVIRIGPYRPHSDFLYDPGAGCVPHHVSFSNASQHATSFMWDFGDAATSTEMNPSHVYKVPGTYHVFLRALGPGGVHDTIKRSIITVHSLPRANFIATPLHASLPDAKITLTNISYDHAISRWTVFKGSDESSPVWESHEENTQMVFNEEGTYGIKLAVTSTLGCSDSIVKPDHVLIHGESRLFVPTAFTPNGDNDNEHFIPVHSGVLAEEYVFSVYDRWGSLVFQTMDINQGWDGKVQGSPAITATYVWLLAGKTVGGDHFTKKGQVTLLR